ncbi:MAG: ABC transporter permease [Alphaproteobacteria bacterium]
MTSDAPTTTSQDKRQSRAGSSFVRYAERFGLIVVWLILIGIFGLTTPGTFLSWPNFSTIFGSQAVLVVVTLGLIIPLTANDFDVSIANVMTMASMIVGVLNVHHGLPIGWCILAALAAGALVGFCNGFFITVFRIHSLIVTLGVGTFVHGITLWISGSITISGISSELIRWVMIERLFGIPLAFYYAMTLCALLYYVLEFTAIGRRMLFVGRGRDVARLSGIRVDRVRWGCMVASALLGSVAGVMYAGTTGAADPVSGLSYLLPAFAAAFLGATSIVPGRFNPLGAALAVYFLVTGITGLTFMGIDTFVHELFYGGALVIAVSISQLVGGREERF